MRRIGDGLMAFAALFVIASTLFVILSPVAVELVRNLTHIHWRVAVYSFGTT